MTAAAARSEAAKARRPRGAVAWPPDWPVLLVALTACLAACLRGTLIWRPVQDLAEWLLSPLGLVGGPLVRASAGLLAAVWGALLLVLCVKWLRLRATSGADADPDGWMRWLVASALLLLADTLLSTLDPYPWSAVAAVWCLAVLALLLALHVTPHGAVAVSGIVLVATTAQALVAVAGYCTGDLVMSTPFFGARATGTLGTSTVGGVALVGFAVACGGLAGGLRGRAAAVLRVAAGINLLALLLTFSRAACLGAAATVVCLGPGSDGARSSSRRLVTAVAALLLVAFALFWRTAGGWPGTGTDRSGLGRLAVWQVGLAVAADHPWLGSGIQAFNAVAERHSTAWYESFHPAIIEPKSIYLDVLIDHGCLGAAVLLALVVTWWRWAGRVRRQTDLSPALQGAVLGTRAAVAGVAVAGLFDTLVGGGTCPEVGVLLACLFGASAGAATQDSGGSRPVAEPGRWARVWSRLGRAALALVLALGLAAAAATGRAWASQARLSERFAAIRTAPGFVPLTRLPRHLPEAVIASEDRWFEDHHGVDWSALHRALRRNLRAGRLREGGSTITMQAVRYALLGRQRSLLRKATEVPLAWLAERRYTKAQLLEIHLNTAYFGLGAYGVRAGSEAWFGVGPERVTPLQAAFLAGLLPEPPATRSAADPVFCRRVVDRAWRRLASRYPRSYGASPPALEELWLRSPGRSLAPGGAPEPRP